MRETNKVLQLPMRANIVRWAFQNHCNLLPLIQIWRTGLLPILAKNGTSITRLLHQLKECWTLAVRSLIKYRFQPTISLKEFDRVYIDEIDLKCHTTSQSALKYPLIYGCINGAHLQDKHNNSDEQIIVHHITTANKYFRAWSYARDPNSAKEADLGQVWIHLFHKINCNDATNGQDHAPPKTQNFGIKQGEKE